MSRLSVVLPAYNEEQMLAKTCRTLKKILDLAEINYELVIVDDGSTDQTWKIIEETAEKDRNVTGVHFSRNFGKEAAIVAGLAQASGNAVAVMDCDLQHPPEVLVKMYRLWEQGYEVVEGIKKSRGTETVFHRKSAGFFYRIMSRATGFNMENASDFKLLDQKAVESVLSMPERSMFFRATSSWVGFKRTSVLFEVQEREAGESKWSTGSLIRYAFRNIVAFTTLPLQFVTIGAGGCFICSLLLLIYSLVRYFTGHAVEGYTTLLIVMLFIGSAVMMSLGIIGYYIARIYEEVKRRPRYIVSRIIHGGHENEKTDS
nr:glycosyltransferase family 2 protein [uncultured Blautia sp.]